MQRYTVRHYFQNSERLVARIRRVRPIFGINNAINSLIVKKIIEKFDYSSAVDIKHTMRIRSSFLETNFAAVRESVAERQESSIRHSTQEPNILTTTRHRILTKGLYLMLTKSNDSKLGLLNNHEISERSGLEEL